MSGAVAPGLGAGAGGAQPGPPQAGAGGGGDEPPSKSSGRLKAFCFWFSLWLWFWLAFLRLVFFWGRLAFLFAGAGTKEVCSGLTIFCWLDFSQKKTKEVSSYSAEKALGL